MTPLLAHIADLVGLSEPLFLGWFLVFLRVSAAVALMPGFGEASLPARVKLGVAVALSLLVLPLVQTGRDISVAVLLAEIGIGVLLGLSLRLLILALQTAGAIIAQSISLAQLFGGAGEPQPVIGNFLTLAAIALALAGGLPAKAVHLLVLSYDLLPQGGIPTPGEIADWGVRQVAQGFRLAFSLAAPFVIASLLYNVALGVINRAMPQLMVAMVGAPAITLGGIALFAIAAPHMLAIWQLALERSLTTPLGSTP
ncbi:flagellar biosynthetic protein FliR [Gemmobacter serpentinus]|uniref:flagellar biosynthetic protein FliR n=1 Tax=Gemmobacter serpentinus TaxID=2652247 RepID=UPI001CF6D20A|nr:flagellar biosynthetic protein FliR [Gemmobacter serpentinus]